MYRFRKNNFDLLILIEDSDIIKLHIHRFVEALTTVYPSYKTCILSLYSQAYSDDTAEKCNKAIFVLDKARDYTKHAVELCATGLKGNKNNRFLLTFGNTFNELYRDIFLQENSANAASVDDVESWVPDLICFIFPKYRNNTGNKYYLENRSQSEQCTYRIETSMAKMEAVKENTYNEHCRCKIYIIPKHMPVAGEDIMFSEINNVSDINVPTIILVDGYTEVSSEDSENASQWMFSLLTIVHCILFLADRLLIHPDRFFSFKTGLRRLSECCQGLPTVPTRLVNRIEENFHGCKCYRVLPSIFGFLMCAVGTSIPYWWSAKNKNPQFWYKGYFHYKYPIHFGMFSVCFRQDLLIDASATDVYCYEHRGVPDWLIAVRVTSLMSVASVFLGLLLICCYQPGRKTIAVLSVFLEAFGGVASTLAVLIFGSNYQDVIVRNFYPGPSGMSEADVLEYITGTFHASFGLNIVGTLILFLSVALKFKLFPWPTERCRDQCEDCES